MSEFRAAVSDLERVVQLIKQLEHGTMDIEDQVSAVRQARTQMTGWEAKVVKWKKSADITDPEKKIYGEQQTQKVKDLHKRYFELVEEIGQWEKQVLEEYAPIEQEKAEKFAAEAELERRHAEERKRQEEEAQRLAEDEERKRKEDEQKKAAEEEAERIRKEEEEKRRQDEEAEDEKKRRLALNKYLDSCTPGQILETSLNQLYSGCSDNDFEGVVLNASIVVNNVIGHPDDDRFKKIRKSNPGFMKDIGRFSGGTGLLFAAGFREEYYAEIFLELHEPSPTEDFDQWKEWYDSTMEVKATFERVLRAITESRYTHKPLSPELFKMREN